MLIASIPAALIVASYILGAIIGVAGFIALIAGAVYIVRSRRISTNNTLADQAITSLTASNAALSSRLDLVEKDNTHCMELKTAQDVLIKQQEKRIDDLRDWVTARDLISDLTAMTRAAFTALDVDPKVLADAAPHNGNRKQP